MLCALYQNLDMYRDGVAGIQMHPWWVLLRHLLHLARQVSGTMAVFMGGQPVGMQRNISGNVCGLCSQRVKETPQHILFECQELDQQRIHEEMYYATCRQVWPRVWRPLQLGRKQ